MPELKTYDLYLQPEDRKVATVQAKGVYSARKLAPFQYQTMLHHIFAVPVPRIPLPEKEQ
jgi:hypothetical protein